MFLQLKGAKLCQNEREMKMKKISLIVLFFVYPFSGVLAQQTEQRPMTVDDGLNMVRVGDALMSPDGEWVFFSKSELDWKKNKRKKKYYRISSEGGEAYQFIGEEGGSSFRFSPKGTWLSFIRSVGDKDKDKDKESQIFIMRTNGGEAVQLTKHKKGLSRYLWTKDESKIIFLANEPKSKEDEKKKKDGYDAIAVDEGPNGQRAGSWRNLWLFDVESKEEKRITNENFIIGNFDVSPDGKRILFTARFENRRNQGNLSEIYMMTIEDSVKTRLTDNSAPESRLLWAPDGKTFAYMAADDKEWELRNSKIWLMNPDTKEYHLLSGDFEGRIRSLFWTPDSKSILFSALQRTNTNLYKLDVKKKSIQQITNKVGSLSANSFSKDRKKFVYTYSNFDTPSDLFTANVGKFKPTRLTDANPWIKKEIKLAKGEVIGWNSKDGLEIEGLLYLPESYKKGEKLPLILNIHGGPAGVFTNNFSARYHVYAGLGYASLCPNVRGSSGYSDEFLRGNMHDIGGGDYQDLMTGVDTIIENGIADPEKLGLRGWSYGGILGGWTITQTDRFKAASVGAMVSDWTSEYGPGFNYDVRLWYIGDTPWNNSEGYRQKSSLTHASNVTTPTIIFHGINDRTDTEPQSMMFFAALKDMGKTARYLRFPREPHGFRELRHQRTRDIEEIRWMQKYVLDIDWEPWIREEDKKKDEEKDGEKEISILDRFSEK